MKRRTCEKFLIPINLVVHKHDQAQKLRTKQNDHNVD